ncbi:AAA family ATPase [Nocardioides sp. SYSU DS0663]|uniref:AAA family ATPase n=1 Tax=Nocardioides sp. SYSU DS0663 TaxID=3416445 RepID=UPI003F4BFDE4
MPVVVDPENETLASLLAALPTGAQGVGSVDRMLAWLTQHSDEYVVVLGPHVSLEEAVGVCESLRTTRPTVSVVLVRGTLDTATLTSAMKAGARDVAQTEDLPAVEAAVARAYQLHVALRGPSGAAHVGKVVTVFSPKGGVGKTTMAVNLALALTDRGARKVCLVDLDLAFGDVAITMQLFPTHSIEQAVGAEDSLDVAMLEGLLTRHHESLMVLAAPPHPDVRERVSAQLVTRVLRTLRENYDYIVVDTAPAFDEQTLTALDETDECVIVATLDVPTLKNVKVALETMEMLNIAQDHRHLLLNRADDAVGIGPDKVEAILGMGVAARVESSIDIAAATNSGTPIVLEKPTHQSSTAIRELAAHLAGDSVAAPTSASTPDQTAVETTESDRVARRFRLRR